MPLPSRRLGLSLALVAAIGLGLAIAALVRPQQKTAPVPNSTPRARATNPTATAPAVIAPATEVARPPARRTLPQRAATPRLTPDDAPADRVTVTTVNSW